MGEIGVMTKIIAHRGASGYTSENTLEAFEEKYFWGYYGLLRYY